MGTSKAYPEYLKMDYTSTFGKWISALNGNCGFGYTKDYKNPNSNLC